MDCNFIVILYFLSFFSFLYFQYHYYVRYDNTDYCLQQQNMLRYAPHRNYNYKIMLNCIARNCYNFY